jgi:putative inorganic carbon (hco3(-)) transporter
MGLALAFSPSYALVRIHLGWVPFTLLELALCLAIAVGGVAFRRSLPWRNPYTWPALLLLLAATVEVAVTPDRRAAAGLWKAYFLEPAAAALVIGAIATQRQRARVLLGGLAVAGTVIAVANIVVDSRALLTGAIGRYTITPPVAIYETANAVPLYLEPLAAFALALALVSDRRWERRVGAGFFLLAVGAILLSYSRAGWITMALLIVLIAWLSRGRWWILGAMGVAGGLLFAVSRSVRQRILVEFDPTSQENTLGLRRALWESSATMLRHHPLFGGGLGGFKLALAPYRDPSYREDLIYPHNLILNFWTETGLLGLAAFLWLLGAMLAAARRGLHYPSPWVRALAIGWLGTAVAFLAHGAVDVPYFKNDQALAFWALAGIQAASVRPSIIREDKEARA